VKAKGFYLFHSSAHEIFDPLEYIDEARFALKLTFEKNGYLKKSLSAVTL